MALAGRAAICAHFSSGRMLVTVGRRVPLSNQVGGDYLALQLLFHSSIHAGTLLLTEGGERL